jgi:3-oxoacyl-[acyl-carrier-protein] synthase-3
MRGPGIVSYGLYIPRRIQTARSIARQFGVPETVVVAKQGLRQKHVSRAREWPSEMARRAAILALRRAERRGIRRRDIGLVAYVGSQWKDYHVWLLSAHLQDALGLDRAFAFDLSSMCTGIVFGLRLARDVLRADSELRAVLLVGASKESYLVRASDPSSLWMDNFADAGVAVVVARDQARNLILGSAFHSDGSLALATLQRGGGARHPLYQPYWDEGQVFLEGLIPRSRFRQRMDEISLKNFARVIRRSLQASGVHPSEVRLLALNHMKRSFHDSVVRASGILPQRSYYLERYGHSQSADPLVAVDRALASGLLDRGPVVLAAAGTGYVWGSLVVRWG